MKRAFSGLLLLLICTSTALLGADKKDEVPRAESPGEVKPNTTALVKTELDTAYFLHVPGTYNPKKGARLVVFLHGSNMNGQMYLRTFLAQGWCANDILLCPNGERGDDPFGANNFTFASAKFVAVAVREVSKAFNVTRTYLGGHSQGGFVTFSAIMLFPKLFDGAFPMAGDCWMQNEPNLWEGKPEVLSNQKEIAIAVIHGRKDPVVSFSQGEHAYDVFNVMGWPMLKLFAPENLGHQFALSPVPEALDWLDAMKGDDPRHIYGSALKWASKGNWADAVPAAKRLLEMKKAPGGLKSKARSLLKKAEKVAKKETERIRKAMDEEEALSWLPRWFEYRRSFGHTAAAKPLVEKYETLRQSQRSMGETLFGEARGLFRSKKREQAYAKLKDLLQKAPCSYQAYYAVKWLADKDED